MFLRLTLLGALMAVLALPLSAQSTGKLPPQLVPRPPLPNTGTSAPPFSLRVAISVDAPEMMAWRIKDTLTRELKALRNVELVTARPGWVIAVTAFDPEPKAKGKRRFSMASAFLQQSIYVDPAVLDALRENPCVPPEKVGAFTESQRILGDLFTMGAHAGSIDELGPTCSTLVKDFVKNVVEPTKLAYEQRNKRSQRVDE